MRFPVILHEYLKNSTLHGARFIVDDDATLIEKLFWIVCVLASWFASSLLILASLDAFENNAISFVADTSYRNWDTNFPSIAVCELKNMDRIQEIAEELWGYDHDFTLEEVLSEIAFFRGESYHTIHECGENELTNNCITSNFSYYAKLVRSGCDETIGFCSWNEIPFDCCQHFVMMETELGVCYAINSLQANAPKVKLNMVSNRITGPGSLQMQIITEANIYILGEEEVPNLVTPKTDILTVGPYVSYTRYITKRDIQNDEETRSTSVQQRNCRFNDENILSVHKYYSYSACIVQCRMDKQMSLCNCTNHLMPNTPDPLKCNMTGLECLNKHYEDLSVVIAKWSNGRKGLVCDCLPSCSEVDISTVEDHKENIYGHHNPISKVRISLLELPTERYKRIVTRGKLDLVVSMGGTTGLFVGASLLSFAEIFYYFIVRSFTNIMLGSRN